MLRETLDRQIHQLQDEVLLLGSMVEQATLGSVAALKNRDTASAHKIYYADRKINEKRYAIEQAVLILIATQQPMAHDLRLMASILEVVGELERMGDYAKGIAKIVIQLGETEIPMPMREIDLMAREAVGMLHRALGAFIDQNSALAATIPADDDKVDALFNKINYSVIQAMIANPRIIDSANLLMWVAHNLERMADRVTNICERTIFVVSGELFELESKDLSSEDNV